MLAIFAVGRALASAGDIKEAQRVMMCAIRAIRMEVLRVAYVVHESYASGDVKI